MKRILSLLLLSVSLVVGVTACGNESENVESGSEAQESQNTPNSKDEKKLEKDAKTTGGDKLDDSLSHLKDKEKEEEKKSETEKKEKPPVQNTEKKQTSESSSNSGSYLTELNIYYPDSNYNNLTRVVKSVQVHDMKVAGAALQALKDGDSVLGSPIPSGVNITGVSIDNGVATVSYSNSGGYGGLGSAGETMFAGSVVYTLTEFPTIQSVRFDSQGTPSVFSHLDGETPMTRSDVGVGIN